MGNKVWEEEADGGGLGWFMGKENLSNVNSL